MQKSNLATCPDIYNQDNLITT